LPESTLRSGLRGESELDGDALGAPDEATLASGADDTTAEACDAEACDTEACDTEACDETSGVDEVGEAHCHHAPTVPSGASTAITTTSPTTRRRERSGASPPASGLTTEIEETWETP
jgi:hypothetical protein